MSEYCLNCEASGKRIAALEAELQLTEDAWKTELLYRQQAEAEVAALKARRCETCSHWEPRKHIIDTFDCDIEACGEAWISPDFSCNRWAERGTE